MRASWLLLVVFAVVFTPSVSAEIQADGDACVTTYDPRNGVIPPRVDAEYCVDSVHAALQKVIGGA